MVKVEAQQLSTNGKMVVDTPHPQAGATLGNEDCVAGPKADRRPGKWESLDRVNQRGSPCSSAGFDPTLRRISVVLGALVLMCLAMAVFVWWRLLA